MSIQINNRELIIRPSSITNFYACAYQWGKYHLEGVPSIPSTRASIGTGVHAAAETGWTESIAKKKKILNLSSMLDAGMESLKEEEAKGLEYGEGESHNQAEGEIKAGTIAYIDEIAPFVDIPKAVEVRCTMPISHAIVKAVSGTIDYLGHDNISDVKTSKRKPVPSAHIVQQSIYKMLAEHEGHKVDYNTIQGIVFKKASTDGMILPMETNVQYAKDLTNGILDTLDLILLDEDKIDQILRPNPSHFLCSKAYCAFYGKCPATINK